MAAAYSMRRKRAIAVLVLALLGEKEERGSKKGTDNSI